MSISVRGEQKGSSGAASVVCLLAIKKKKRNSARKQNGRREGEKNDEDHLTKTVCTRQFMGRG